jgi:hypothetical protein
MTREEERSKSVGNEAQPLISSGNDNKNRRIRLFMAVLIEDIFLGYL